MNYLSLRRHTFFFLLQLPGREDHAWNALLSNATELDLIV